MSQPSAELLELEKTINWHDNGGTFLLPGEDSIDGITMRRRTALYYKQIRGDVSRVIRGTQLHQLATELRTEADRLKAQEALAARSAPLLHPPISSDGK